MDRKLIDEIEQAFIKEDKRLSRKNEGNPFTICTECAIWIKKNFFPLNSEVVGFYALDNPDAEVSLWTGGHDFLLVDKRYIFDMWLKYTEAIPGAPIFIDTVADPKLARKWYGDPKKWKQLV